MKSFLISNTAKAISSISRLFGLGAGVTWPGEIAVNLDPQIISALIKNIRDGVIIVAGTNGKTTTSSMTTHILRLFNKKVIYNSTGANLLNGIAGELILSTDCCGRLKETDYAIFEVDEASLPAVLTHIKNPKAIVLLNLFRDQLDRYGEVDAIAEKWKNALKNVTNECTVVANADDPAIYEVTRGFKGKKLYFGIDNKKYNLGKTSHASDSIYCLNCGNKLSYKEVYLSHFGNWYCPKCRLKRPTLDLVEVTSPLLGVYTIYNSLASILTARALGYDISKSQKNLSSFIPAFGRQEEFIFDNKKVKMLLSKNPTGFNESIRTTLAEKDIGGILIVLNDLIPDGTDVSWIWDVDFEDLINQKNIVVSGLRAYDLAIRLKYALQTQNSKLKTQNYSSNIKTIEDLRKALTYTTNKCSEGKTVYVLPTYSAMLDLRKIITGRKIW